MLSIIIVGWNSAEDVAACLASIGQHPPAGSFEVIYVDNGSRDDSVERVRREHPAVQIIANKRNVGFQKANNQGLTAARGTHLLLLNPDTSVLPNSLDALIGFLGNRPDVGAVSPRCLYPDGTLQWSVAPFPSLPVIEQWFQAAHPWIGRVVPRRRTDAKDATAATQEQAYAYGACFATKREVIDDVGLMDEGFFLTGGEVAWSREMQRHGWKTYYLAEASIVHRESALRATRSWASEIDWVLSHRRLLYLYEGVRAGLAGDLLFSIHLVIWSAGRAWKTVARAFGISALARRSTA